MPKYRGINFAPPGTKRRKMPALNLTGGRKPVADIKKAMQGDESKAMIDIRSSDSLSFTLAVEKFDDVAAAGAWLRFEGKKLTRIEGWTILLTRIDHAADEKAIALVEGASSMKMIPREWFHQVRQIEGPVAATFFTGESGLNDPGILFTIPMFASAWFNQMGIGQEE
jgi:hypothetical protein